MVPGDMDVKLQWENHVFNNDGSENYLLMGKSWATHINANSTTSGDFQAKRNVDGINTLWFTEEGARLFDSVSRAHMVTAHQYCVSDVNKAGWFTGLFEHGIGKP
jgi:hypothetical protein